MSDKAYEAEKQYLESRLYSGKITFCQFVIKLEELKDYYGVKP